MPTTKAKPLSLTQAAYVMRRVIAFTGIGLVTLIVGRVFLTAAIDFWKATHPEPPPPPTVGFGVLPKLEFPRATGTPTSYKLEIPPQRLTPPSDRENVYFIPSRRASLLAVEKATQQAAVLGFLFEPERITSEVYRWRRTQPLPSILDYNIINGTFRMIMDWQSDPAFLQNNRLPTEDNAINTTRQILSSAGLLSRDIATGSAKVTYLKASGGSYDKTVSFSEADFLQIDISRTPIRGVIPFVTEEPDRGIIRAIITGKSDTNLQLALMEYNYLPIDYLTTHTYPIITPSQAYDLLSRGGGYIARMPISQTEAVIRDISLAFYDTGRPQQYLQPVYVLSGDGGFVAYVPAIAAPWVTP